MNSEAVMKEIVEKIESKLDRVGLMFRIFSRSKKLESIEVKLKSNPSYGVEKKLQDIIGIRIVLYFNDDIDTVREIMKGDFLERSKDVSIDESKNDEFKALRYNIIYALNEKQIKTLNLHSKYLSSIDTTFELQIRTIFSEGWHEVEHDLRYKCKSDWNSFDSYSRKLNGVYATLETSEWTMIKIFDELAYNHYKNGDWSAMFRQKFRLRFTNTLLDERILDVFEDKELVKKFFRLNRSELIMNMNLMGFNYPMYLNNLIYFANIIKVQDERISVLTPNTMIEEMIL